MRIKSVAIVVRTQDKGLRSILYTLKHNCDMLDDISVLFKVTEKLADDVKIGEQIVSMAFINESEV